MAGDCQWGPVPSLSMEPPENAAANAIRRALIAARSLRGRFVTARVAGDDEALQTVAAQALAACDELVLAVPRLTDRHVAWLVAVSRTLVDQPKQVLARVVVNHLTKLSLVARRPVVVPDTGTRFVGELSDVTLTRPR